MNQIKITSFRADYINLTRKSVDKDDFELGFHCGLLEENPMSFIIKFKVLISSSLGYELSVEYIAFFETDEAVTEEFKNSNFVTINAPAIAYPFLRSFISTLTLNAGYNPVLIPTINFLALSQKIDKSSQEKSLV